MISEERCFLLPAGVGAGIWRRALAATSPLAPAGPRTEWVDTYFDTQDGRFGSANYRLRRRVRGRSRRWQLLTDGRLVIDQPTGELPARIRTVSQIQARAAVFPLIDVAVTQQVHGANTGSRPRLRVREEHWRFRDPLEDGEWVDGPSVLCLEGSSSALATAATALSTAGLPPVPSDPAIIGMAAIGVAAPGAPFPEEFCLQADDSAETAIRKNLAKQAFRMWANTRGARHDLDPEFVHDLRVATRRARFALRLAAGDQKSSWVSTIRAELVWIAGLLGTVRDLDVFLLALPRYFRRAETPAATRAFIMQHFRSRRTQARQELTAALESERYRDLLAQARGALTTDRFVVPTELQRQSAAGLSAKTIAKAARRVRRWEPDATDPAAGLHRLRIAGKRLRYTAEFFAELYDGQLDPLIKQAVKMQDLLGAHQDAKVAGANFLALAKHTTAPERLLALGALIQAQREAMVELRRRFGDTWPRTRKRLKVVRFRLTQPRDGC